MTQRRIGLLALAVALGGTGAWLVLARASSPDSAGPASVAERSATLDNSLRAIADAERDAPRDRWDPEFVVQQVGRAPDSLTTWVRENTAWVPYRGTLRGPVGVLMDRRGNGLDRALLLAELLTRAGHTARLARAELTAAQAEAMLGPAMVAEAMAQQREAPDAPPADTSVRELAVRYGLNANAVEATLDAQRDAMLNLLTELEERSGDQAARLLDAVPGPLPIQEWAERWVSALVALRDHWWVQVQEGAEWRDLDPAPRDSTMLTLAPNETVAPDAVAPELHHEVVVRVVAERLTGTSLAQVGTLEHVLRPAEVIDQPVVLQFWPAAWPRTGLSVSDSGRSFRRAAFQQEEWSASLMVGDRVAARGQLAAAESGVGAPVAGPLGLGGAIAGALGPPRDRETENGVLTAVWLEYEVRAPGRRARVIRRSVFDLLGPANRHDSRFDAVLPPNDSLRLVRSLALMMRTEILLLGAQLAPEFVIHTFAQSAVTNAGLLRAIAEPGLDQQRVDSLLKTAVPGVDPLHTFAVLRQEALGDLAFLDRAAVITRHRFPTLLGAGVATNDAFDIVANDVGVALAEGDGFAARLAQGVWDTNLEALLGGVAGNAAEAFDRAGNWSVLESARDVGDTRLTRNARVLLARELEAGALIVAPDATLTGASGEPDAWWRIDPETGDALGIGPLGWGQGVDYATHLSAIWEMASGMVYAFAQCHAIPQAANALNILGSEFWRLGLTPSWVTQPPNPNLPEFSIDNPKAYSKDVKEFFRGKGKDNASAGDQRLPTPGKDFEEVAAENMRKCTLDAIKSGFLATAPIILMQIRFMRYADGAGARSTRLAALSRGPLSAGRRPGVGWRGRPSTGHPAPRISGGARRASPAAPAPVSPPPVAPARTPHRFDPRPHVLGNAAPGSGPFQGDPANRAWHRENWHPDPNQAHQAARALGNPVIYDNADRAAVARYNTARQAGLSDQAARQASYEEWWKSTQDQRRARGIMMGLSPNEYVLEHPIGSPSPPPGSPPPGSTMGTATGSGSTPPGGSPMATSFAPPAGPQPGTGRVSDARMAVGIAGLTGGKTP